MSLLKILNTSLARCFCTVALIVACFNNAHAFEPASGEVLLLVDGNISESNAVQNNQPVAEFDLEMLESLGKTTLTTVTPWTGKDATEFTGVRINTLLDFLGVPVEGAVLHAAAANDYWFELSDTDFEKYPIIIAFARNGINMRIRELGPLWIMFPWDDYPELMTERSRAAAVWQLTKLTVK